MTTSRTLRAPATLLAVLSIAGCSSITGLNASSSYACKAPEGVKCDSVSGTYHNAIANNLPSQRKTSGEPQSETRPAPSMQEARYDAGARPVSLATVSATLSPIIAAAASPVPGASLRSGPRILRLWIKPWEDADGDLNGESVVYLQVEGGRWLVDHAQRQIRDAYAPVRTLGPRTPSAATTDPSKISRASGPERATTAAPPRQMTAQSLPDAAAAALRNAQQQAQQQAQRSPQQDVPQDEAEEAN